jgi:hypothetical protein
VGEAAGLTLGVGAAERGRSERREMRRKTRGGGWVEHGEFGGFGGFIYINGHRVRGRCVWGIAEQGSGEILI